MLMLDGSIQNADIQHKQKIDLQTFANDTRGFVNIVSSSNNLKLAYTSADNNLTASLEWDEF